MKAVIQKNNRGVATLEMLIALTFITLTISSVIILVFGSQSMQVTTQTNQEALYKAQEQIESARAAAQKNFNDPYIDTGTRVTIDSSGILYSKTLTVSKINDFTKKVMSTISWGSGKTLALQTLLTNLDSSISCNQTVSGDWKNPIHYDFPTVNLLSPITGNNSNGLALSDIKVYRDMLYMAASDTANNGFTLYACTLPNNPATMPNCIGGVDNAPGITPGINAIATDGNYIYAANSNTGSAPGCSENYNCAEMQVINITNPASPAVVRNFKIPASTAAASPKLPSATSIFYSNGYVYLGLAKVGTGSANGEFVIIDVGGGGTGTPLSPAIKGSYFVGNGINSIFVKDKKAYIASPNTESLTIIDVNPLNLTFKQRIGGYSPSNLPNSEGVGSNHGKSIYPVGNSTSDTIYFGRTYGTGELKVIDATNLALPTLLGTRETGTNNQASVNGMVVRGNLTFLITNAQFQVWNTFSPSSITPWSSDGTTNTFLNFSAFGGNGASSIYCSGDKFYTAIQSTAGNKKDILTIITALYPTTFTLANSGNLTLTQGTGGNTTITATKTSGFPGPTTFSISGLPAGVTYSFSSTSCIPTCSTTLTINTLNTTPANTYPITVTAGTVTTNFNLNVNLGFAYTVTNPGSLTIVKNGPAINFPVTVTMSVGPTQAVTITPPNPKPSQITITPATATCTPNAVTPFTCSVNFSYRANNSGSTNSYPNQKMTGSPNGTQGPDFTINVTN